MIEIATLVLTLCIPYSIVVGLLVSWNQESPPSTVEDSKDTVRMLEAHKGNLQVQVAQLRSALLTVSNANNNKGDQG